MICMTRTSTLLLPFTPKLPTTQSVACACAGGAKEACGLGEALAAQKWLTILAQQNTIARECITHDTCFFLNCTRGLSFSNTVSPTILPVVAVAEQRPQGQ